ncbi:MAG: ABC transporter ATP-binding protein [Thermodesulfovibrionales bacterium]|nr:ABC transporter ATP-binding protein [Thermodesulfovibrionales bacterium]
MSILLELKDIETSYGDVKVLKGISISINRGEIVSLIGNNGAGKSTTLMTISGILRPNKGDILFNGTSIVGYPPHEIVRLGLIQCPEGRRIFPRLTVRENLLMGGFLRSGGNLDLVFEMFPVLKERQNQYGGTLSGGEQQMLALARALMSNPVLLMLDEPSLGISPIITQRIFEHIEEINKKGVTILLVEQNAYASLKISHRAYVLENGYIKIEGTGQELLDSEEIKVAYLGIR